MLQTLAKIFITGTGQTQTHEGCRWTPFTLQIHVDHTFFEDTKVLFRSILHRCAMSFKSITPHGGTQFYSVVKEQTKSKCVNDHT